MVDAKTLEAIAVSTMQLIKLMSLNPNNPHHQPTIAELPKLVWEIIRYKSENPPKGNGQTKPTTIKLPTGADASIQVKTKGDPK